MSPPRTRYDLLAVNLTLAVISALLMAAVGGSVKVVQLLEKSDCFALVFFMATLILAPLSLAAQVGI